MDNLIYVAIVFIFIAGSGVYMTISGKPFTGGFREMEGTEEQKRKYARVCGPLTIGMGACGALLIFGLHYTNGAMTFPLPVNIALGVLELIFIIAVFVAGRKIKNEE